MRRLSHRAASGLHTHKHTRAVTEPVRRSQTASTSPVPGGVGLRVPVATSRLELPPDLLGWKRKTEANQHKMDISTVVLIQLCIGQLLSVKNSFINRFDWIE